MYKLYYFTLQCVYFLKRVSIIEIKCIDFKVQINWSSIYKVVNVAAVQVGGTKNLHPCS